MSMNLNNVLPKFILITATIAILACNANKEQEVKDIPNPDLKTLQFAFLDSLIVDTLTFKKNDNQICFNQDLDSLAENGPHAELGIIDLNNAVALISWHPFMGRMEVQKVSNTHYEFIGKTYLPFEGSWDDFRQQETIKYVLLFQKGYYQFFRDTTVKLNMTYDPELLSELETFNKQYDSVESNEQLIAGSMKKKLQVYEYQLFASMINGISTKKQSYLDLIDIAPGGEFREHVLGNWMILVTYGIIEPEGMEFYRLISASYYRKNQKCY